MVINIAEFLPGDFTRNADFSLPTERLKRAIVADAGREKTHFIDATRAATALFGNSVGANIFLVGYAYQLGAIPLSAASIEQAIELNGEAVEMNKAAFRWGRRAAVDPAAVETLLKPAPAQRAMRAGSRSRSTRWWSAASPFSPTIRMLPMPRDIAHWVEQGESGRGRARSRQERAWPKRSPAICSS